MSPDAYSSRQGPFVRSLDQLWDVVGGGDKGGILVREGCEADSTLAPRRLGTGAVVKELEVRGERLRFHKLTGAGPTTGWVSIRSCEKRLLRPRLFEHLPKSAAQLCAASERLRADHHVVISAVGARWQCLEFASDELKADREIVWAAVSQDGTALQLASPELRKDAALGLAAELPREPAALGGSGLEGPLVVSPPGSECGDLDDQDARPLLRYAWRAGALEVEAAEELGSPVLELARPAGGLAAGALAHVRFQRPGFHGGPGREANSGAVHLWLPLPRDEQRIDPRSDQVSTFLEVRRKYDGECSTAALESFWRSDCEPVVWTRWRRFPGSKPNSFVWRTQLSCDGGEALFRTVDWHSGLSNLGNPRKVLQAVVPTVANTFFTLFAQAATLAESLVERGWGFVDGFLRGGEADALHLALRSWWLERSQGAVVGTLSDWGEFPELRTAEERVRILIAELRRGVPELATFAESEPPMRAAMHESSHPSHFDCLPDSDFALKRVCTLILYLNPFWCEDHGGLFRLYPESLAGSRAEAAVGGGWVDMAGEPSVDIPPLHGRLLAFLCEGRNAHQVLPSREPRFAVTWWLRCR